jgi:hypothetical protein
VSYSITVIVGHTCEAWTKPKPLALSAACIPRNDTGQALGSSCSDSPLRSTVVPEAEWKASEAVDMSVTVRAMGYDGYERDETNDEVTRGDENRQYKRRKGEEKEGATTTKQR